jgi:probable rRNA maturation factor
VNIGPKGKSPSVNREKGKRPTFNVAKGKRPTFNAQRSTFKEIARQLSSLNVERWKLNVERLPLRALNVERLPLRALNVERLPIVVNNSSSVSKSVTEYLRKHLQSAHALLSPPLTELSVALVGDKKMSDLHLQFMNISGPTDVLTFPLELDPRGKPLTGEVIICVPDARRRCKENGSELRKELLLYALHGMLHLSGFDDRTDRQFRRMHRMEDDILTRLGVGPVFDAAGEG